MSDTSQKMTVEQTLHEIAKFHFILSEGRKGNHLLFSPETIRGTFSKDSMELGKLFQEKLDDINQALNQTFSMQTFEQKREFINSLPQDVQHAMVYGYFQLLEGKAEEEQEKIIH